MADLVLDLDVACHMLADLDQIVTEMEMDYGQFSYQEWIQRLRYAVDGEAYRTRECECSEPACQWCEIHGDTGNPPITEHDPEGYH